MKKTILRSITAAALTSCIAGHGMAETSVGGKNEAAVGNDEAGSVGTAASSGSAGSAGTGASSGKAGAGTSTGGAVAPTLQIHGNTIQNIYLFTQKKHNNGKGKGVHIANDVSDLLFIIAGQTSGGIGYKYKIAIEAYSNASPVVSQNYVEFNTLLGSFQLGNVVGPEDTMIKDAGAIVAGTGAFDGGYYKVFNLSAFALRGNDNIGDTGNATKFVYYTPEMYDLRFGVSYTPDTAHLGDDPANTNTVKSNGRVPGQRTFFPRTSNSSGVNVIGLSIWSFGAAFKKELGKWELNLTGDYIYGDNHLAATNKSAGALRLHHTKAFQLGTVIGYKCESGNLVQVGAGYLKNGKSALFRKFTPNAKDYGAGDNDGFGELYKGSSGRACNFGAAYTMGVYKFSGAYQHTHRRTDAHNRAKNQVYSLAADVNPVAGLKFFGELNRVLSKSNKTAVALAAKNVAVDSAPSVQSIPNIRNKGTVFIMGTKISF